MEMTGRSTGSDYGFGFNGKMDDKWNGNSGAYSDFGARIYDNRLGKWMSTDPHKNLYPSLSPYASVANSPIMLVDKDGKDIFIYDRKGTLVSWIKVKNTSHIYFQIESYEVSEDFTGANIVDLEESLASLGIFNPKNLRGVMPSAVGVGMSLGAAAPFYDGGKVKNGVNGAFEAVVFLKGPNMMETHYYYSFGGVIIGAEAGIEPYVTLGFNLNESEDDFTAEAWGGLEESYSLNASGIGGVALEWSNKNGDASLFPIPSNMSQLEIVLTPPAGGSGKIGASYSMGNVWETDILPSPTEAIDRLFGLKRLSAKDLEKLKQNNLKREAFIGVDYEIDNITTYQNTRFLD